jgi:hypothetical protein
MRWTTRPDPVGERMAMSLTLPLEHARLPVAERVDV